MKKDANAKMVERFQCPGCVGGGDTKCGRYVPDTSRGGHRCSGHVIGTVIMPGVGHIALGMPRGFNRPGLDDSRKQTRNAFDVRLFTSGTAPTWDRLNVPVWAMEHEGCLFVRTYQPRLNVAFVDVVEDGTLALVPNAIDVGQFYNEID